MSKRILIVEDDLAFIKMLAAFLERKNFEIVQATSVFDAKEILLKNVFDIVITDIKLPDASGEELLDFCNEKYTTTGVILMTGYAEVTAAVEAIKKGALDYISKPFRPEELLMIINDAEAKNTKSVKVSKPALETESAPKKISFNCVKGISEVSKKFQQYLELVSPTDMCVLIEGASGTGKEVAAKTIHSFSDRKEAQFVAVDCGAIPKEIAASEFFGHLKGSFTGAITDKKGHFESAHKGTLFLDEVGNLSYENQIQLLRALQERKIKPVGSSKEIEVDVRIISATNENLKKAVAEGTFREDLYHRLNEFSIHIPSLNERKEDLYLFVDYFLHQANASLQKDVISLSKDVSNAFSKYNWPGNLRELKNVLKRAVLLTTGPQIPIDVIPREVLLPVKDAPKDFSKQNNEKQLILNALQEAEQNKSKAARMLNITRKTLYNKLEQYQIEL